MLTGLSARSHRSRARRRTTGAALVAFAIGAAGFLFAAPAAADGPTTFTNSAPITIPDTPPKPTPATPYPSSITVSGMTGPVSDVDVRLNGFTHSIAGDVDLLLVGPSGANLVLLSDPGDPSFAVSANNATVTFDDSAATGVPQSGGPIPGTVSYRPTDNDPGAAVDSFPSPAPAPSSATTLGTFSGTNPNGTWSLYAVDDTDGDVGSISGGWSVIITTSAAAPTTTALTSSPNPSTFGQTVTFTATVTSASPVTTGTVTFRDGATTLGAPVTLNASAQATFTTSALTEGSHTITATYSGTLTLLTSNGAVTQVVQNAAPVCADDAGSTAEDVQLADNLACVDPGDTLTYAEVAGPSHGSLLLNPNGSFTYDPNPDFNGTDSFTFTANDGMVDSNVATYTVSVAMANDAPVLGTIGPQTVTEGSTVRFTATASDRDLPPDTLTFSLVGGPSGSTIDPHSGVFSWLAPNDGISTFDVCVSDGSLSDCETVTVTVTNGATLPNTAMPAQRNDVMSWIVGAWLISCLALLALALRGYRPGSVEKGR